MKLIIALLVCVLVLMVARNLFFSFRAQTPADYEETGPMLSLAEHLRGDILADGLIFGPDGRVTTRFAARMYGEWRGNEGALTEDFTYSNGRTQQRKWFLTLGPEGTFTATADDIIGVATGVISGATAKFTYRIKLPPEAGGFVLDVTDWLYLTENGTILNKSEMRKFGIKVAELVATMRPATDRER